jgi:hypothetical protein
MVGGSETGARQADVEGSPRSCTTGPLTPVVTSHAVADSALGTGYPVDHLQPPVTPTTPLAARELTDCAACL